MSAVMRFLSHLIRDSGNDASYIPRFSAVLIQGLESDPVDAQWGWILFRRCALRCRIGPIFGAGKRPRFSAHL